MSLFLSIIIPVYNLDEYIIDCLDSLLTQNDEQEIEVIIVNDGSIDNSKNLIEDYIDRHKLSNFHLYNVRNQGVGAARNLGLSKSRGDYVFFLDGDDFIASDFIDYLKQKSINNNSQDIISFSFNYVDHKKTFLRSLNDKYPPLDGVFSNQDFFDKIIKGKHWIWTSSAIYSKNFLKKNELTFSYHRRAQDLLFIFSCILKAKTVLVLPKVLSFYRKRRGSTTNSFNIRNIESVYAFLELQNRAHEINDANLRNKILDYSLYLSSKALINQITQIKRSMKDYQEARLESIKAKNAVVNAISQRFAKERNLLLILKSLLLRVYVSSSFRFSRITNLKIFRYLLYRLLVS